MKTLKFMGLAGIVFAVEGLMSMSGFPYTDMGARNDWAYITAFYLLLLGIVVVLKSGNIK